MDELLYISTLQFFYFKFLKIVNIRNLFLCTMCITIELWSSIEKVERRHCYFFFCVFLFIYSLILVYSFIVKTSEQIHTLPAGARCSLTRVWWKQCAVSWPKNFLENPKCWMQSKIKRKQNIIQLSVKIGLV